METSSPAASSKADVPTGIRRVGITRGPWKWSRQYQTYDGRSTYSLLGANGYGILSCDGEGNSPHGLGDHGNANLIAAAPALYEALQEAVGFVEDHPDGSAYDMVQKMLAALKQARGES